MSNLEVIKKDIGKRRSFYRLSDGSWVSISTDWDTKPRQGNVSGRGTEEAIPYLAKLVKEEMRKRKYKSVKPSGLFFEEKNLYATKIVNELAHLKL
jgi:hypothetical protein